MLDDRERSFATEYIINKGNAYKAALAAGYAKNTAKCASEWLNETQLNSDKKRHLPYKPELHDYIKQKLDEIESARTMTAKEVIETLSSIGRGEIEDSTVVVEGQGDGISEARVVKIPTALKDRLSALKELAKIHGIESSGLNINVEPITFVNDIKE